MTPPRLGIESLEVPWKESGCEEVELAQPCTEMPSLSKHLGAQMLYAFAREEELDLKKVSQAMSCMLRYGTTSLKRMPIKLGRPCQTCLRNSKTCVLRSTSTQKGQSMVSTGKLMAMEETAKLILEHQCGKAPARFALCRPQEWVVRKHPRSVTMV